MPTKPTFKTEANLVKRFVRSLKAGETAFGVLQITTEWDHRSGYVDVLARDSDNNLIAFEAKLKDWKRAFHQAYRNTAYANQAYILLPAKEAQKALQYREEFDLRGIGLCSIQAGRVEVLVEAAEQEALLTWLRSRAHDFFDGVTRDQRRDLDESCWAGM
jgi:hypothetical protein